MQVPVLRQGGVCEGTGRLLPKSTRTQACQASTQHALSLALWSLFLKCLPKTLKQGLILMDSQAKKEVKIDRCICKLWYIYFESNLPGFIS